MMYHSLILQQQNVGPGYPVGTFLARPLCPRPLPGVLCRHDPAALPPLWSPSAGVHLADEGGDVTAALRGVKAAGAGAREEPLVQELTVAPEGALPKKPECFSPFSK